MKKSFNLFSALLLLGLFAAGAEGISHFFLPAPVLHKLPMLKQIADPIVGYRLAPNQKAYSLNMPVSTNQWGYRGKDWAVDKPANTFRIAVLGASLTFGHGLKNEDIFTERLEETLNKNPPQPGIRYEVLNFGVGGYDIGHSVHVLKEDVLKFSPDLVLLNIFVGDVFCIRDYSFYPEYFRLQEKIFSRPRWEIMNLARHSRLAMYLWDRMKNNLWGRTPGEVDTMIQRYAIQGMNPLEGPNADGWRFIVERMKDYADLTRQAEIPAVFMVLPTHEEISDVNAKSTYAMYLKTKAEEFGIHYLWFLNEVRKNQTLVRSFFIPYDYHFNKEGHQWIALLLAEQLRPLLKRQLSPHD